MNKDKKEKEREREPDLSTPEPADPGLMAWLETLFHGDERATSIKVTPVYGRHGREVGTTMKTYLFKNEKLSREELVEASNELMEAMQNHANVHHMPMAFELAAHNSKKGPGAFEIRAVRITPNRFLLDVPKTSLDQDIDADTPGLEDTFRKRAKEGWEDARAWMDKAISTLGGAAHMLAEQGREKDRQVEKLFQQNEKLFQTNMELARQINEVMNNALDRELARADHQLVHELKRKGMNLIAGLVPGVIEKMSNGAVKMQGGRSSESMALESVVESLSQEENIRLFGAWKDDGTCTAIGILSEPQVRIIAGLIKEELKSDAIDRLISGPEAITMEQYSAITSNVDMEKLLPLLSILNNRKSKLNAPVVAQITTAENDKNILKG